MMGANALKLQVNSTPRSEIRPYFILPLATFIHLDALRGTEVLQPSPTENAPDSLGIFGLRWVKRGASHAPQ